jgi:hypothetical protein
MSIMTEDHVAAFWGLAFVLFAGLFLLMPALGFSLLFLGLLYGTLKDEFVD